MDSFNVEGQSLTPEQVATIDHVHSAKAALLAEMQTAREAQYVQQHGHIGVEMGRELGSLESMSFMRTVLHSAGMWARENGYQQTARTLDSLAAGIVRAAVERYGPDAETKLYEMGWPAAESTSLPPDTQTQASEQASELDAIRDIPPSDEAAISPVIEETPQVIAARERRAKKRAGENIEI